MAGSRTEPQAAAGGVASKFRDLKARVASGVVLAALALGLTWWGTATFAALVGLVAVAMAWEWSTIVRGPGSDAAMLLHIIAAASAAALAGLGHPVMGVLAVTVAVVPVVVLAGGRQPLMSGLGVLYVGLPAVALIWLRADSTHGLTGIMFLLLVVWTSDIGAFVAGRLIGGPKLWPRVSPNKTWAGLLGGLLSAGLAAMAFAALAVGNAAPLALGILALVLALVAQGGDLAESALKRAYGVKDASNLIPGHGGFMDRVDSLVAVAVVAAIAAAMIDGQAPARALLLGH